MTRIGSNRAIRVDVRIVAATNEHLPRRAAEGKFRADLLDRLSFEVITLPPLRARLGDVAVLTDFFGRRMASELGWESWPGFDAAAVDALDAYAWPGNVRELRNVVERAVYRWDLPDRAVAMIEFDPFASPWVPVEAARELQPASAPVTLPEVPASGFRAASLAYERALLVAALEACRFNQRRAATQLKLSYDQLRHALRRHDMLG